MNKRLVQSLLMNRVYDQKFVIAAGKKPTDGVDGKLEFKFETERKQLRPKIQEDGKVDLKDLESFETAFAEQELVVVIPPTFGDYGTNVRGDPVEPKPGKLAPKLPKGKNTRISDDEMKLVSEITGQILYVNGKVEVDPVITVPSDVGPSTGNIDFAGSVVIKGSVKTGYSVRAQGYVEVHGTVEAAEINAEGDVKLLGGIQGMDKAVIQAGGDLFMRFSENATISCGGNIHADSILHSKVMCGGHIRLEGRKCAIVGGVLTVARWVFCKTIGSVMSGTTEIITGHSPNRIDEFEKVKEELETARSNFEKAEKMAGGIMQQGDIKTLPPDKKALLIKIIHSKAFYSDQINTASAKLSKLSEQLKSTSGEIFIADKVFAGSKIMIGNAMLLVNDNINHCTLRNIDGRVTVCTYTDPKEQGAAATPNVE